MKNKTTVHAATWALVRAFCAEEGFELVKKEEGKTKVLECSIFPPRNYVTIATWLQTEKGKKAIPNYLQMTWVQRADALTEIVGWEVDGHQLMKAINRLSNT